MANNDFPPRDDVAIVDHRGLRVLDFEDCLQRVASTPMGRVAFRDRGDLAVLPVTHVVDHATFAFRVRWDSRLADAVREDSVAFEVDDYDPVAHTGWSVLVKGEATVVDDETASRHLEELLDIPWDGGSEESYWIRIRPDEVSGRELVTGRDASGCC